MRTAHLPHKEFPLQFTYLENPGYSSIFARRASLRRFAPSGTSSSVFSRRNFTLGIGFLPPAQRRLKDSISPVNDLSLHSSRSFASSRRTLASFWPATSRAGATP